MTRGHTISAAILVMIGLFLGLAWLRAHDAWMKFEAREAGRQEKISANKEADKSLQQREVKATSSNQQIDSNLQRQLAEVLKQSNSHPTTEQTVKMIQESIAGLRVQQTKDDKGQPFISVPDTQENRDKLNQADAEFKSCRFELTSCSAKLPNFQDIIAVKNEQIALRDDTIKLQAQTIKDLKRFGKGGNIWARVGRVAIPSLCGAAGAGLASQGGIKPKGISIAALGSAGACAAIFHF